MSDRSKVIEQDITLLNSLRTLSFIREMLKLEQVVAGLKSRGFDLFQVFPLRVYNESIGRDLPLIPAGPNTCGKTCNLDLRSLGWKHWLNLETIYLSCSTTRIDQESIGRFYGLEHWSSLESCRSRRDSGPVSISNWSGICSFPTALSCVWYSFFQQGLLP